MTAREHASGCPVSWVERAPGRDVAHAAVGAGAFPVQRIDIGGVARFGGVAPPAEVAASSCRELVCSAAA